MATPVDGERLDADERSADGPPSPPAGRRWDWRGPHPLALVAVVALIVGGLLAHQSWADNQRESCGDYGAEVGREAAARAYDGPGAVPVDSYEFWHDRLASGLSFKTRDDRRVLPVNGCSLTRLFPGELGDRTSRWLPEGRYRVPDGLVLEIRAEGGVSISSDPAVDRSPGGQYGERGWSSEAMDRLMWMTMDGATPEAAIAYARPDLAGQSVERIRG